MSAKFRGILYRALRATLLFAIVPTIVIHFFLVFLSWGLSSRGPTDFADDESVALGSEQQQGTLWEVLKGDARLSKFAYVVGMFDDIVADLTAPQKNFTIYAPVDEAFTNEYFAPDLPWFYWYYLAQYQMGPGVVTPADLSSHGTVPSFVYADIFQTYRQRIGLQKSHGQVMLNHKSKLMGGSLQAINGFVHLIDEILVLPNSTAHVLRGRPSLSLFNKGLHQSGLAAMVNDTNTHVGQTVLAPTDSAFTRLGDKALRFLFSRAGTPYLEALLRFHIVQNHTLFSDVYFPHQSQPMATLLQDQPKAASSAGGWQIPMPTLHRAYNITATIRRRGGRPSICVSPWRNLAATTEIEVSVSDLVVMDGVIHEVDSLFLPPKNPAESPGKGWLDAFRTRSTSVQELTERLEPWLSTNGVEGRGSGQ